MARLSESEAHRLIAALEGRAASPSPGRAERQPATGVRDRANVAAIARAAEDPRSAEALGKTLTLELAAYLNRPVRCAVSTAPQAVADTWRFEAADDADGLWMEVEARLGVEIAAAMIGSDDVKAIGRGRRVRGLVERVALRTLRAIAAAAGARAPQAVRWVSRPASAGRALGGGSLAIGTDQHAWAYGVSDDALSQPDEEASHETIAPSEIAAPSDSVADAAASPPKAPHTPQLVPPLLAGVLASEPTETAAAAATDASQDEPLRFALASALGGISDRTHCHFALAAMDIMPDQTDAAGSPSTAALRLALTSTGTGALVASIDRGAALAIADAVSGAPAGAGADVGEVSIAAAEAVLREVLDAFAQRLAGVASEPRRIVRLDEAPLPAHVPHREARATIEAAARTVALHLLVPSWMAVSRSQPTRTP